MIDRAILPIKFPVGLIAVFVLTQFRTNGTHGVFGQVAGAGKAVSLVISFLYFSSTLDAGDGSQKPQGNLIAYLGGDRNRFFIQAQKIPDRGSRFMRHFTQLTGNFHKTCPVTRVEVGIKADSFQTFFV